MKKVFMLLMFSLFMLVGCTTNQITQVKEVEDIPYRVYVVDNTGDRNMIYTQYSMVYVFDYTTLDRTFWDKYSVLYASIPKAYDSIRRREYSNYTEDVQRKFVELFKSYKSITSIKLDSTFISNYPKYPKRYIDVDVPNLTNITVLSTMSMIGVSEFVTYRGMYDIRNISISYY